MKTTIEIPDKLFREMKSYAAKEGSSLKDLLTRLIADFLASNTSKDKKKFKLKDASVDGKGLQPGVSLGDWETIRAMIYEGRGG